MVDERHKISLSRVIEAVNNLPDDGTRQRALAELRRCDPATRYYTLASGRADAVPARA